RGEMVAGETFPRPEIPLQRLPQLGVHQPHWSYPKAMERNVCIIPVFTSTFSQENHPLLLVAFISLSSPCTDRGWMCCPKGWRRFQRSCYFLSLDKMNWAESEQNCTGMGSQLVVINSKEEQVGAQENFYIGLFAEKVGQWQWVDKTPYKVTAAFWREGEPTNIPSENCTVIGAFEQSINNWNDVRSDLMHHRICEAAAVTV
uniref:C-type lectin domain-containing protein n=1 Tax=Cyanoderma ruficeps TaxID=181631 RepID=A0A8C3R2D9_9PASS